MRPFVSGIDRDAAAAPEDEAEQRIAATMQYDLELASRCVAGEVAAWEDLYQQCHDPLRAAARMMLGSSGCDSDLVDEMVARVWFKVVDKDGQLLTRYDPRRGARLLTFLKAITRTVVSDYFRAEHSLHKREMAASDEKPQWKSPEHREPFALLGEFLDTLTCGEKQFCDEVLLASPLPDQPPSKPDRASVAARAMTYRIRKKLRKFLGKDA